MHRIEHLMGGGDQTMWTAFFIKSIICANTRTCLDASAGDKNDSSQSYNAVFTETAASIFISHEKNLCNHVLSDFQFNLIYKVLLREVGRDIQGEDSGSNS